MMKHLIVEKHTGDTSIADDGILYYALECRALSFDGGSLIVFEDEQMSRVKAAFAPGGWTLCRWGDASEVQA